MNETDNVRAGRFAIAWRRNKLKVILVVSDATAISASFLVALALSSFRDRHGTDSVLVATAFATVAGIWTVRSQGLFLARVSAIRVVEITRLARAVAILFSLLLLFDRVAKVDLHIRDTIPACGLAFVAMILGRSTFRAWLNNARGKGRYRRTVAIVGADAEATRLIELISTHREIGMDVIGVLGDYVAAQEQGLGGLWLGDVDDAEDVVEALNLSGVVIAPGGAPPSRLNPLVRHLHMSGRHVQVGTGISGIDARRLRALPLAYEPLFYVEAPSLAKAQITIKRCFDVVVSTMAMIVLSPVLLVVALAVKIGDGGPVLFKQTRVGRSGRPFGVYKFRTMHVNAESRLAEFNDANERLGPLFKMERDPRITRVGRFLRETSLDELPQLINVVKGEMSLVGPRPALPAEVAVFPAALRMREQVRPGITGLWQVEARDSPSFEAYRRLDLFYVENWSLTLDFMILIGTIEQTVTRVCRIAIRRWSHADASSAAQLPVEVTSR